MFNGFLLGVRSDFKYSQYALQKLLPPRAMNAAGALHATPQFSDSDGRELDLLVGMRTKPRFEVEGLSLRLNDHIGIDQKRHGLTCGWSDPRACSRS